MTQIACKNNPSMDDTTATQITDSVEYEKPFVPDWHKNATIYEVNLRQYTEEGTFAAFEKHLPRLKEMGMDILWFMPVHEISKKNRKGTLGSPYAVTDYYDVNPDHGTMEDFKQMLKSIHDLGMHCIIDWVPNHSGWDNAWITEHKDWYTQDSAGNVVDPIDYNTGQSWGWTDVADFNYNNPEMRQGMIDAMLFWIRDIGIDGFRVDVAHGVPADFWVNCTTQLYDVKPIFMLAEAEVPEIVNDGSFVADYAWEMHHLLNDIAKSAGAIDKGGKKLVKGNLVETTDEHVRHVNATEIDSLLAKYDAQYNDKGYKMQFTSNHDENSWAGTEFTRMGAAHQALAVLTATFNGIPLVYSGQESAMDKQLTFFEKDNIPWGDFKYADFYKTLFDLKHRNKALWNGKHGGKLQKIGTGQDQDVYAFLREKDGDKVIVIINLSNKSVGIQLDHPAIEGAYTDVFTNQKETLKNGWGMKINPFAYYVFSNK